MIATSQRRTTPLCGLQPASMTLLAREQSLDAQDFFLNGGFEGTLDDNCIDPWSAPDVHFGGLGPGQLLVSMSLPSNAHCARCLSASMQRMIAKAALRA